MSLKNKLADMLKAGMRSKNEIQTSCIRLLTSAIKNKEIEIQHEATDDDILKIVEKQAKQRNESIVAFKAGGRTEMAEKEEKELAILSALLPKGLDKAEIIVIIKQTIQEVGAKTSKEFGIVMKALMPKVQGKADGKLVTALVKEVLV